MRQLRGEARAKPPSIKDIVDRVNEFILKLQEAYSQGAEPKAKAKAVAKQKPQKTSSKKEPVWETFEEALEAASKCKKCLPTLAGTKGCRGCMGEHFEQIRQKF